MVDSAKSYAAHVARSAAKAFFDATDLPSALAAMAEALRAAGVPWEALRLSCSACGGRMGCVSATRPPDPSGDEPLVTTPTPAPYDVEPPSEVALRLSFDGATGRIGTLEIFGSSRVLKRPSVARRLAALAPLLALGLERVRLVEEVRLTEGDYRQFLGDVTHDLRAPLERALALGATLREEAGEGRDDLARRRLLVELRHALNMVRNLSIAFRRQPKAVHAPRTVAAEATAEAAQGEATPAPWAEARGGRRPPRALIVDDDGGMRRFVSAVLAAEGYEVETADGPAEALAFVAEYPPGGPDGGIDLVVLDLRMAQGGGQGLYERLANERPDVTAVVLFSTGAYDAEAQAFLQRTARPFLMKPYGLEDLKRAAAQMAGARAGYPGAGAGARPLSNPSRNGSVRSGV